MSTKSRGDMIAIMLSTNTFYAADVAADGTVRGTHHGQLTVDPLAANRDLAAQDLREQLAPLKGRWKHALVGLSLDRVLTTRVHVPAMPDAAVAGYIGLQAERDFLIPPDGLAMGWSLSATPDGAREAVVLGLPVAAYDNLAAALREFGVRSLTVTAAPLLAVEAFDGTDGARLIIGDSGIDMAVNANGAVVLLRRVAGESASQGVDTEELVSLPSQLRVSLAQVPSYLSDRIADIQVVGTVRRAEWVANYLMSLPGRHSQALPVVATGFADTDVAGVQICAAAGRRLATGHEPGITLSRPVAVAGSSRLPRSARRPLVYAAVILVLLVASAAGAIIWQQRELARLEADAAALVAPAQGVREAMDLAAKQADWFSDEPVSLDLMLAVTEAFPEYGTVWLTRLEVSERRKVRLTGKAKTREAWLAVLEALRTNSGLRDLRVAQAQESADGRSPMVFSVTFDWVPVSDRPKTRGER